MKNLNGIDPDAIAYEDPGVHFETCVQIRDEEGKVIFPVHKVLQRRIDSYFQACWAEDRPCRGIIVKSRKRGASTKISHLHYWATLKRGYTAGLIGHLKLSSTKTLVDMFQNFYNTDTFDWGVVQTKRGSEIKWDNGAEVQRFTDQSPDGIRSATINVCHSTETAYYANSELTLDAAFNAIGHKGFSSLWLESTPAGMAGVFPTKFIGGARWPTKDECPGGRLWWKPFEAELQNPNFDGVDSRHVFVRIFSSWFEHEEFFVHLSGSAQKAIEESLDSEEWYEGERELIARYGNEGPQGMRLGYEVDNFTLWEQLDWRRNTLFNFCHKDKALMGREYPAGPLEGFKSAGRMFFDRESVSGYEARTKLVTPQTVTLMYRSEDNSVQPHRVLEQDAVFRIYEEPVVGCRYLVAADPMRGVDQHLQGASADQKSGEPDRHGVGVIRAPYRDGNNQIHKPALVAMVKPPSYVPLHIVSRWIAYLSLYYGKCMVVPEVNAHGLAVVYKLEPYGVPVFRMPHEDPKTGRVTKAQTATGWLTTTVTRPLILDELARGIFDQMIDIWDADAVSELRTMVTNLKTGKIEADSGAKDDLVMMLAIGFFNIRSATMYDLPKVKRRDPPEVREMEGQFDDAPMNAAVN